MMGAYASSLVTWPSRCPGYLTFYFISTLNDRRICKHWSGHTPLVRKAD